jgi:hypothetical protein
MGDGVEVVAYISIAFDEVETKLNDDVVLIAEDF